MLILVGWKNVGLTPMQLWQPRLTRLKVTWYTLCMAAAMLAVIMQLLVPLRRSTSYTVLMQLLVNF